MFSKRNKPPSISTELVVLFTLAAALLLSCALGSFYWLVVQHASAEDNAVLADKVRLLRGELQELFARAEYVRLRDGWMMSAALGKQIAA